MGHPALLKDRMNILLGSVVLDFFRDLNMPSHVKQKFDKPIFKDHSAEDFLKILKYKQSSQHSEYYFTVKSVASTATKITFCNSKPVLPLK